MKQPNFGKELVKIRKQKGITQEELATRSNVTIRTIQRIESGIVNPRSYTIRSISEILKHDFISEYSEERLFQIFLFNAKDLFNLKTKTMKKILILTALFSFSFFGIISISKINGQSVNNERTEEIEVRKKVTTTDDVNNTVVTTVITSSNKTRFTPLIEEHKTRIIYNIKDKWVNTGIKLDSNKVYYIVASGLASTSSYKSSLWIGPEGKEHELNDMPMYSMIGKKGTNEPFFIGKSKQIIARKDTPFFLGYNDDMFSDNIGYYVIDIFEGTEKLITKKLEEKDIKIGDYYYE